MHRVKRWQTVSHRELWMNFESEFWCFTLIREQKWQLEIIKHSHRLADVTCWSLTFVTDSITDTQVALKRPLANSYSVCVWNQSWPFFCQTQSVLKYWVNKKKTTILHNEGDWIKVTISFFLRGQASVTFLEDLDVNDSDNKINTHLK